MRWCERILVLVMLFFLLLVMGQVVPIPPQQFRTSLFRLLDANDISKKIAFDANSIDPNMTRTIIMPNWNVDLSGDNFNADKLDGYHLTGEGNSVSNTTPLPANLTAQWGNQTGTARKVPMYNAAGELVFDYIKVYDVLTPAQILTFSVATTPRMVMASGQSYTDTPSFTLTYQGAPSDCSIDVSGGEVNPTDYPYALSSPYTSGTGPAVYARTSIGTWTYTASATVDNQACSKTATVSYWNEYRYGQTTTASGYTDTDVDGFATGVLFNTTFTGTGSIKVSITVNISSGNYFVFAMPSRLLGIGIAFKDKATGFAIDMSAASPYTVSNRTSARLFSEEFFVYRSTNTGLGSITIDIY